MLTVYVPHDGRVDRVQVAEIAGDLPVALWYDLLDPTPTETQAVERALALELPSREDMQEIEASSRLYQEDDALFLTVTLVTRVESARPEMHAVSFVLTPAALVTMRYTDPVSFRNFAARLQRAPFFCTSSDLMFAGLMEAVVDRQADVLEHTSAVIEGIAQSVFDHTDIRKIQGSALQRALQMIGASGTLISGISESLISLSRMVTFLGSSVAPWLNKETRLHLKTLSRDIKSLHDHAGFLAQKSSFLLDATLGLINIEQNAIIKIFSVAAVAFLPPTLIASIYGMNFSVMPELDWPYGYPFAIALMILSAIGPFLYFRRKGWL